MRLRKSPCRQHSTCQIADLLFAFRPRPRYLAMFYAYFDEAGHPSDSDVVSMAAVERWLEKSERGGYVVLFLALRRVRHGSVASRRPHLLIAEELSDHWMAFLSASFRDEEE